jgi:hypothetical protein
MVGAITLRPDYSKELSFSFEKTQQNVLTARIATIALAVFTFFSSGSLCIGTYGIVGVVTLLSIPGGCFLVIGACIVTLVAAVFLFRWMHALNHAELYAKRDVFVDALFQNGKKNKIEGMDLFIKHGYKCLYMDLSAVKRNVEASTGKELLLGIEIATYIDWKTIQAYRLDKDYELWVPALAPLKQYSHERVDLATLCSIQEQLKTTIYLEKREKCIKKKSMEYTSKTSEKSSTRRTLQQMQAEEDFTEAQKKICYKNIRKRIDDAQENCILWTPGELSRLLSTFMNCIEINCGNIAHSRFFSKSKTASPPKITQEIDLSPWEREFPALSNTSDDLGSFSDLITYALCHKEGRF